MQFFLVEKPKFLVCEVYKEKTGKRKRLEKYKNFPLNSMVLAFVLTVLMNTPGLKKPLNVDIFYARFKKEAVALESAFKMGIGHYNFEKVTIQEATDKQANLIGDKGILVVVESADKPL